MKKILVLASVSAILNLAAFGAAPDGQWKVGGSDKTAPKKLFLHVSGASLAGTMDGAAITNSGVEGNFFWFHVLRNGTDVTYKGQIRDGKIELREVGGLNRVLSFTRAQ